MLLIYSVACQNHCATSMRSRRRGRSWRSSSSSTRARSRSFSAWKLKGEQHSHTLHAANNYAFSLAQLKRSGEAKALLRKTMPVARRILGESHEITITIRWNYARALFLDSGATLDDLREAVKTLEEAERIARRVLGGAHPLLVFIERDLEKSRATLRARETPSPGAA